MSDYLQRFIEFLQKDVADWEEAARFCEKQIHSVQDLDEREARSGRGEAEKFRARISERKELIAQLERDTLLTKNKERNPQ
ncbi:MAG: hypothetical protein WCC22_13195 [Terriglobales bacterium]